MESSRRPEQEEDVGEQPVQKRFTAQQCQQFKDQIAFKNKKLASTKEFIHTQMQVFYRRHKQFMKDRPDRDV